MGLKLLYLTRQKSKKLKRFKFNLLLCTVSCLNPNSTDNPTRQTSTFAEHRKYLIVLILQKVVFLISNQTEISSRCLFDIYLISKCI